MDPLHAQPHAACKKRITHMHAFLFIWRFGKLAGWIASLLGQFSREQRSIFNRFFSNDDIQAKNEPDQTHASSCMESITQEG